MLAHAWQEDSSRINASPLMTLGIRKIMLLSMPNNIQDQINQFIQDFHAHIFEAERLPVAMAALVIVTLIGVARGALGGMATPFYWHLTDIAFGKFGDRMDKSGRPKGDLIFRGFLLTVVVIVISYFIGRFLMMLGAYYPHYSVIEVFSLSILLTSGAVFAALGQLYKALGAKKAKNKIPKGAYFTIARSTQTNLSEHDDYTITRVGMGLSLKSFDKGVVAPIVWFLLLGLPGAYIYAGLAFMAWRFGKDGYSRGFGDSMIALEKLMGFVPNILSGLFIALAGILTPTAGMTRSFLAFFRSYGQASYAEGGMPLTAAAYALNVSLGGPTVGLDGKTIKRSWFGPKGATAKLEAVHLHRVAYICFMAHLLFLASLSGAFIFASQ